MMSEQDFEKLAAEAATGLRGDRELYLDVTQEFRAHLEDTAEHYTRAGHAPEESRDLACRAFGSPLDVAAEVQAANRGRMKLRALLRLAFGALIVPLAVLLALYVGYGRMARVQSAMLPFGGSPVWRLPALPFMNVDVRESPILRELRDPQLHPERVYRYWEAHRRDPDSRIFYAYYALFAKDDVAEVYRRGEQLEPQNAFYPLGLAFQHLRQGMVAQAEKVKKRGEDWTDALLDRQAFEQGIVELQRAVKKPYLHSYEMEVTQKTVDSLPSPRFTEDYLHRIAMRAAVFFPHMSENRELARKVPGCARILIAQGRYAEAEAVMDTWKPLARLLATNSDAILIYQLAGVACGASLSKEAAEVYTQLGRPEKAREARLTNARLRDVIDQWKAEGNAVSPRRYAMLRQHGAMLANITAPVFGGVTPAENELTPSRMQEHVLAEEAALNGLLLLLVLLLLGTLIQGALWHSRLRRAASAPLLLMPPAHELLRALLLGVVLPVVAYWLYSRLPGIGGREYGWSHLIMRFAAELLLVISVVVWLPAHFIRRYIRRRCDDLDVSMPDRKEEAVISRKVRGALLVGITLTGMVAFIPGDISPLWRVAGVLLAIGLVVAALVHAAKHRQAYGLYYGTLARSLAPVYAWAIILLTLTAQPWLLHQEELWLKRDTVIFNGAKTPGVTALETRAAHALQQRVLQVLDEEH